MLLLLQRIAVGNRSTLVGLYCKAKLTPRGYLAVAGLWRSPFNPPKSRFPPVLRARSSPTSCNAIALHAFTKAIASNTPPNAILKPRQNQYVGGFWDAGNLTRYRLWVLLQPLSQWRPLLLYRHIESKFYYPLG